ncbi:transcription factor SipA3, putative [Cordyceps militaris CM01]|uniref:Transcription factor SipA3, putative n=1 Tax=Cordyceps militaris (strain CM01) TaxID=983644 RepID=G3JBE3_CORMM|nr:transcription factor SipA3, putative [Cordyceps militaris CM01]EGX94450.1 transcription factor SipA3, putative [Cordyceps militaris CM01]
MDPASLSRSSKRAVPVGLLEAALDSPTFRSTALHFGDQIEAIEKWLNNYVNSTSKLLHDFLALEDTINSYLVKTAAPVGDTTLDNDYTLLALKRVGEGSREWLTQMQGAMKRMESTVVEPIRSFMSGDLRNFKDTRRALEAAQRTYDSTLARYVGQHKTKEPSALREDAFSVFESRKIYLQASIDFCQAVPQLRSAIDRLLVTVCSDIWKEIKGSRDATANAMRWSREMERVRGWSNEMEMADAVFRRELQAAKKNIYDLAIENVKPSRELEDYNVSTIPFLSSRGPVNLQPKDDSAVVCVKQGWLFLRVLSNKPTRYTWIRRWHYCRDRVFGWLIPGAQGVLQGDEIGVLLCNARPAVGEERRFCFEIKTNDQSLILQAENQKELTEWLEVFEVAKKAAFDTSRGRSASSMSRHDPAFSINPPSAPEFSANNADTYINVSEDAAVGLERATTMLMPPDAHTMPRQSVDAHPVGTIPRRSFTALGKEISKDLVTREDGESGREHAARIIQKLDLHRKSTFGPGNEGSMGSPAQPASGSGIASLISASHNVFPGYPHPLLSPSVTKRGSPLPKLDSQLGSLAPSTLEKPPVVTTLSRAAAIHAADKSSLGDSRKKLPASIVANYWGTNIWTASDNSSQPVLPRREADDPFGVVLPEGMQTTLSTPTKEKASSELFPINYPTELRLQTAQFKLLFPDVQGDEKLVLVFRASWSFKAAKDSSQGSFAGDGRVYVTPDYMYFYSQRMGLITTFSVSLDIIAEVTAHSGRESDSITLRLGEDMGETVWEEVNLKVYLDDLRLLHSRLNLIIDNIQAEEPANTEHLIFALINLERVDERPSPSIDGWDDSSLYTPIDTGNSSKILGRSPVESTPRLRHSQSRQRLLLPKIHLPNHAVEYEPENMTEMAAERHFEISAKACFHVLFGDRSFVFPKLYFEHRAQQIAQGPWVLVDQGRMRREFQFKVNYTDMLGRDKSADVKDEQTIDLFSDHVTYVVTHTKTAWHLPHSTSFKLISKIVITHMAKSKCKLAIWVKIDWSRTPALSKNLVERQALRDIKRQAEELAELATDQVRKLGSRSRTNKAIHVYGQVGNQTQVVVFSPGTDSTKKQAETPRTLTSMIFDTVRSFAESCITSVIMWTFAGIKRLFDIVTAHRLIIALLLFSSLVNVLLTSSSTSTWWQERSAARFMHRIGVVPHPIMSKAIYFSDLAKATGAGGSRPTFGNENSTCYDTFADLMEATDLDAPWDESGSAMAPSSRSTARRIRRTRQRLGTYRHDLLVAMRVVNSIEREMMQSEWENWLVHENSLCDELGRMLGVKEEQSEYKTVLETAPGAQRVLEPMPDHQIAELKQWQASHCRSCRADYKSVMKGRSGQFEEQKR